MKDHICAFVLCSIVLSGSMLILNSCQEVKDFLASPAGQKAEKVVEEIVEDMVEYELEIDMDI